MKAVIDEEVKQLLSPLTAKDYKGNLVIISPRRVRIRSKK